MGLPKIDIVFRSLAKSAIEKGSKSTVALILKDKNIKDKLLTLESIKDIPKQLEEENKEQIELAFKGGYKTPKKIIFYCLKEEGKLEDALSVLEAEAWDYLAIPCIQKGETDKAATWIKGLREEGIKVQAVLPDCKADHEGIINFTTTYVKVGEKTYTNTQYCSRIAGIFAGTPLNISATYYVLQEVTDVPHIKKADVNKAVDNGELIIINDGEKCKIGRAVNSLTTTREGISEDYKKIKIVSVMDLIYTDIKKTFENEYIGKYSNSYDNQVSFCMSIAAYFENFEKANILAKNLNKVEVNIEAMKLYWKARGIDLSNAKQQEIEENTCSSNVFLKGKVKILDAMEDLEFNINM
ncbi:phage tail sheath protein [Clostridium niameyense]|uniref:Phage tail sheath protein n=1 Tax=Clostridium niameyense TaxID=1622073 RepID=A0A6M0RCQ6_9CLOT|nr:phage tail sheath subtilisin-like domain-containing protein [Clostridium niameyense]NEZ47962.1 phage tail sheath protein [Clostridium niameyense]